MNRRQFLGAALAALGAAGCSAGAPAALLPSTAPPSAPAVVPRAAWNAREVDLDAEMESGPLGWYEYEGDLAEVYRTVAIHHSAHLLASNETMRSLQNLHMDRNRWADIGYHYGIDAQGVIYAGRDLRARGASVAGYNTGTLGVVVMGSFEREQPRPAQLNALRALVIWLAYALRLTHLAAHSEFNPDSICPGPHMLPHLDALAAAAGLQRGIGGYQPPTAAPASLYE